MGVLKFQLTSPDAASRLADLRKAYVTGLDRTPSRVSVEFRQGVMSCHREGTESGRLFVPWPVPGFGTPIVGNGHPGRARDPYNLAVELARGKLNDLRNQLADWRLMGLRTPADLDSALKRGAVGVRQGGDLGRPPSVSFTAAQASLSAAWAAGNLLVEAYTGQVLQTRLAGAVKLPTQLVLAVEGDPKTSPLAARVGPGVQRRPGRCRAGRRSPPRRGNSAGTSSTRSSPGPRSTTSPSTPVRSWSSAPAPCPTGSGSGRGTSRPSSAWSSTSSARPCSVTRGRCRSGTWSTARRGPTSWALRGRADPDRRPGHPGRPPDRPPGAVHRRRRAPLGRVDGV